MYNLHKNNIMCHVVLQMYNKFIIIELYNRCIQIYIKEVEISMAVQKKLVALRLKPITIEKLKSLADARQESLSEYIRKLLETHLLMQ